MTLNKNRIVTILTIFLFSASLVAETVYKKTKPDGTVEFSDQASQDSEEVKVRKPTSFSPPSLPRLNLPTKKLKPKYNYVVSVNQPANDTTIVNKSDVTVSITVRPSFAQYAHQIRYQLDEQSVIGRSTSKTFKNVSRGTHNLKVTVVDRHGEAVSPVVSSTFHMKRFFKKPTIAKPKPPSN